MSYLVPRIQSLFWTLIIALLPLYLTAQSSSESIYSDQKFGDNQNPSWYRTPFLWIGLLLLVGFTIYYFVGKRKSGNA